MGMRIISRGCTCILMHTKVKQHAITHDALFIILEKSMQVVRTNTIRQRCADHFAVRRCEARALLLLPANVNSMSHTKTCKRLHANAAVSTPVARRERFCYYLPMSIPCHIPKRANGCTQRGYMSIFLIRYVLKAEGSRPGAPKRMCVNTYIPY